MIFRIDRTIIQSNFSIFVMSRFHTWQTGGLTTTKPAGDSFLDREINTLFLVANKRGNTYLEIRENRRPTDQRGNTSLCCELLLRYAMFERWTQKEQWGEPRKDEARFHRTHASKPGISWLHATERSKKEK